MCEPQLDGARTTARWCALIDDLRCDTPSPVVPIHSKFLVVHPFVTSTPCVALPPSNGGLGKKDYVADVDHPHAAKCVGGPAFANRTAVYSIAPQCKATRNQEISNAINKLDSLPSLKAVWLSPAEYTKLMPVSSLLF